MEFYNAKHGQLPHTLSHIEHGRENMLYDFDGPFDEAASLGHAEINFLKANIADLADTRVPLQGKLALTCLSKLHLRIFVDST
ncbi:hypothetical protein Fmac_001744 [Flemingia macrophylla]|uniref:Uncharacterized protein n=1 Tax=Flemingia macrophylla TaxID=520843 RepID=A0ABD1NI02_9FABA